MRTSIRRYVLAVAIVAALIFFQGTGSRAATVQIDGDGYAKSITGLNVGSLIYDIEFVFGNSTTVLTGVPLFPDADAIVTEIASTLNLFSTPAPFVPGPGSTASSEFYVPSSAALPSSLRYVGTQRLDAGVWYEPVSLLFTTTPPGSELITTWAIPTDTSLSPVPLPAALPLFMAALALLGMLGWRRNRSAVT